MKKTVMCGLGPVVDKNWNPIRLTRKGVMALAKRTMPADLKAMGFGVGIWEGDEYFRFSYGRKA